MENHSYSLENFIKAQEAMVATSQSSYDPFYSGRSRNRDYTQEEAKDIVQNGSIARQSELSRSFFNRNGFYKRTLLHYASILKYTGILIPNPNLGQSLQNNALIKRYHQAVDLIERMNLSILYSKIALATLIDGTYYGVIKTITKTEFSTVDLPFNYCRTRFQDLNGTNIIEFNLQYFDTITEASTRNSTLAAYPQEIETAYRSWTKNKSDTKSWYYIPTEIGICFQIFDGRPLFLQMIPSTIQYDESIDIEQARSLNEIRKIIVQEIPHLATTGELLFEPDEAEVMHRAATKILSANNPYVSVLTTYAKVSIEDSKTNSEASSVANIDKMKNNVYNVAGASPQLFASAGNISLEASLNNDLALMMILVTKFESYIQRVVNAEYSNSAISFNYTILPITWYNQKDKMAEYLKMATVGYSFLLPALVQGFSQKDLGNLKDLENNVLKLSDKMLPLQSSYTRSDSKAPTEEGGRPPVQEEEKADQTKANEESIDNGGKT